MRRYFVLALVAVLGVLFVGCGEAVKYEKPEALVDAFAKALADKNPAEALKPLFADEKKVEEVVKLIEKGLKLEGAYTITDNKVTWEKAVYMEGDKEYYFTLVIAEKEKGNWNIAGFETGEVVVPVDEAVVLEELKAAYTAPVKALGEQFKVTGNIQPYIAFVDGVVTGINSWAQSGEDTKAWDNQEFRAELEKLIMTFKIAEMGEVNVLWVMDFPLVDYVAPVVEAPVEAPVEPAPAM